MNERIRELADKAGILFNQGRVPETGFEYEGAEITVEDLKKFAELIVKECAGLCNEIGEYDEYPESEAEACAEYILKHFGVEE